WICYGYALLVRTNRARYYLQVFAGLAGVLMVRPHVALLFGIALFCPYLLAKTSQGVRGVVIRMIGSPLLLVATFYLAMSAQQFLQMDSYSKGSVRSERVNSYNQVGGSAFRRGV